MFSPKADQACRRTSGGGSGFVRLGGEFFGSAGLATLRDSDCENREVDSPDPGTSSKRLPRRKGPGVVRNWGCAIISTAGASGGAHREVEGARRR